MLPRHVALRSILIVLSLGAVLGAAGLVSCTPKTDRAENPDNSAIAPLLVGDAAKGAHLYDQLCTDCHSPHENDVGPMHWGVFGRKAGLAPGYAYSAGLKSSEVVWNEQNLNQWLIKPADFIKGAKMRFSVANAQDRADIIAYLRDKLR